MSKYFVMAGGDALRYLSRRDTEEATDLREFQRTRGEGADFVDPASITRLVTDLSNLKNEFPDRLRRRDQEGGRFEQRACEIVHRCLSGYPREVLADMDFWTWLAVAKLSSLVEWRFGTEGRQVKPENYGIGKRVENMLFRLWLRADLVKEENTKDPYELARTGDQDLWRSHIIRQGYANARTITKALLRLQAGRLRAKRLNIDGIRELAKRLRRLRANVVFEYLTAEQAESLIIELSTIPDLAGE